MQLKCNCLDPSATPPERDPIQERILVNLESQLHNWQFERSQLPFGCRQVKIVLDSI